ncbi:MAG: S41 family peptidase [Thermoleophilia bacterium]
MPRSFRVFLIALAVSAAFLVGIFFGGHYYRVSPLIALLPQSVRSAFFPGDNMLQLERQVEGLLEAGYYQPVDRASLENGAMKGMIGSLGDPYSAYYSPDDYRALEEHTNGEFVGIGVILEMKAGQLTVISPIENSPASEAGIAAGDIVVAVDDQLLAGRAEDEAAALMRGEPGTTVNIKIHRGDQELVFPLVRRVIEIPIVSSRMLQRNGKKIGYVSLKQFSQDAGVKLRGAVDKVIADGAEGIILDLRNNGGGLLNESVEVSSIFIQNGPIVSVVGRDGGRQVYEARGNANENIPLVVLINGYTASASEIVSGALKDDHRALLVGEKTFGKGVVQLVMPLTNGGALKYTSGSYHTPADIDINKVGIQPDVPVSDDPATPADEVLDRGLAVLVP